MTSELFSAGEVLERVPFQDADVSFVKSVELSLPPEVLLARLIGETSWRAEEIVVWGKRYTQPRLIAWFGDPGMSYSYSGIALDPNPWTALLLQIKGKVEAICGETFNSVLLNYYRDNRDSMGMHSDDEPELGPRPAIASLSLGAERPLIFKHKTAANLRPVRLLLPSGSLLLMKGETQRNWKHGIPKEDRALGPRVNLTFRRIHSNLSRASGRSGS